MLLQNVFSEFLGGFLIISFYLGIILFPILVILGIISLFVKNPEFSKIIRYGFLGWLVMVLVGLSVCGLVSL
ncbi:MAG: hypothetical protein EAZ97_14235 [Bacteroidetes bacterium]|nr:MAG: hypothetical protein EAZ97_14235 [Bacteroidota bacterium]